MKGQLCKNCGHRISLSQGLQSNVQPAPQAGGGGAMDELENMGKSELYKAGYPDWASLPDVAFVHKHGHGRSKTRHKVIRHNPRCPCNNAEPMVS